MKVLIYAPLAVLGHHFETDLELAESHLLTGDHVTIITCDGALKDLEFMSCKGVLRCSLCESRCGEGLELIKHDNLKIEKLGKLKRVDIEAGLDLNSFEKIKSYSYKENDIGSAYLSSLISDLRNPNPEMENYRALTKISLETLQGLVDALESKLEELKPDLVYFFNGRFSLYRPLLRICHQKNIPFFVHERGSRNTLYSLTKNNMPHDIDIKIEEIEHMWSESPSVQERENESIRWFEGRANGQMLAWRSFTKSQKDNLLPENWDFTKRNVSFFISSEDEFSSVPGWEMTLFKSQVDAINIICQKFATDQTFHFYVRMHPNLRGLNNPSIKKFFELEKDNTNCTVISPESPINTYSVLKSSEKIISFGTTVGVEATFWGIPAILLGKSLYGGLGASHIPITHEQTFDLLREKNLKPASREAALKYGLWAGKVGIPFQHYNPVNLTTGSFKGKTVTGSKLLMAVNYAMILTYDLKKIAQGEYSLWHLSGKIKNKLALIRLSK